MRKIWNPARIRKTTTIPTTAQILCLLRRSAAAMTASLLRSSIDLCRQEQFLRLALARDPYDHRRVSDLNATHGDIASRKRNFRRFVYHHRRAIDHGESSLRRAGNVFQHKIRRPHRPDRARRRPRKIRRRTAAQRQYPLKLRRRQAWVLAADDPFHYVIKTVIVLGPDEQIDLAMRVIVRQD